MSVQLGTVTLYSVYASTCRFTERAVLHFVAGHFMVYYTEPVAHMSPVGSLPLDRYLRYVENPLKSRFPLDRYHCSTINIVTIQIQIHYDV